MENLKNQFYPTPQHIIKKILEPYIENLDNKHVLEPSAGKGDILDYIHKYHQYKHGISPILYAIEIDQELQYTLQGKQYQVIGNDFLKYSGDLYFDMIIMNPPFAYGTDHLLKAWDIIKTGNILCLLNAETINNPYTEKRKLLTKIIETSGTVENLGNCFSTAERQTDIDVVLVTLNKKTESKFNFSFCSNTKENTPDLDEDVVKEQGIALNDVVGNFLIQYDNTKEAFTEYMKAKSRLHFYSNDLISQYDDIIKTADECGYDGKNSYNNFANKVRSKAWQKILGKLNMNKYMTSSLYNSFDEFIQHQGCMDLTKENIFNVLQFIIDNRKTIMKQAILDVFDTFTKYHNENRCHVEGWKTNESWKVNKKIILPYWCTWGEYWSGQDLKKYGDRFKTQYSREYEDIDKVMCHITGKNFDNILGIKQALDYKFDELGKIYSGDKFDNTCHSTFFNIKFFKKGTVHLEFIDEDLWNEFNRVACIGKKWLPDDTRPSARKKSDEMEMFN